MTSSRLAMMTGWTSWLPWTTPSCTSTSPTLSCWPVEEFLPVAGPSAESLMNLYGDNGVYSAPKQPAQPAVSPTPPGTFAAQVLAASEAAVAPRAAQAGQPLRNSGRRLLQQMLLRSSSGELPLLLLAG